MVILLLTNDRNWACWAIAHNERYIATLGNGFTIWDRATLELVHHFTGVKWIHGGIFINDDVLMVYTGDQKLYFYKISQKKPLWIVPRPRELDASGDMCCCHIPGTEKVACITQGKTALDEHYLLIIDCSRQELFIKRVPNCYRVVTNFVWTQELGLTFLARQAKGDNKTMLYRIIRVDNTGDSSILFDGESTLSVLNYSGHYLFMADYSCNHPNIGVYPIEASIATVNLKLGKPRYITIQPQLITSPVGTSRLVFPAICSVDENTGLLVTCHKQKWVGIYDFHNNKMISEHQNTDVIYGMLLDDKLLMGCSSGFFVEQLI